MLEEYLKSKEHISFEGKQEKFGIINIDFIIGKEIDYHREATKTSSLEVTQESVKKAVLHLPTVPKEDYNLYELSTPDDFSILKNGRPMSENIRGIYTPHIIGKEVSRDSLIKVLNSYIDYKYH